MLLNKLGVHFSAVPSFLCYMLVLCTKSTSLATIHIGQPYLAIVSANETLMMQFLWLCCQHEQYTYKCLFKLHCVWTELQFPNQQCLYYSLNTENTNILWMSSRAFYWKSKDFSVLTYVYIACTVYICIILSIVCCFGLLIF